MTDIESSRGALRRFRIRAFKTFDFVFIGALHLAACFLTLGALLHSPEGAWDRGSIDYVRSVCFEIIVLEVLAFVITAALVKTGRMRSWWYWVPAVLLVVAAARAVFSGAG